MPLPVDTELERPDPIALAVPVARPRPEWVRPFLDEYSKCGNVIAACDRVGIGLYKVRHYRRSSAWFTRKAREAKGRYPHSCPRSMPSMVVSSPPEQALDALPQPRQASSLWLRRRLLESWRSLSRLLESRRSLSRA